MDDTLRNVLLMLLQYAIQQEQASAMYQPPEDKQPDYPPGSKGDYLRQLLPLRGYQPLSSGAGASGDFGGV